MAKHDRDLDSLFQALADPTRRAILSHLMQGEASVSDLAQPFDMALPSFMGHLAKLESGGLIETEKPGRTRICRAIPEALTPAQDWLDEQRTLWTARLDRLEAFLDALDKDPES